MSEKPECVDCGLVMTNDSMKKSKLIFFVNFGDGNWRHVEA